MNGFQASQCSLTREVYVEILGAFAELRKLTFSFVVSVFPSVWNRLDHNGRIIMKFYM